MKTNKEMFDVANTTNGTNLKTELGDEAHMDCREPITIGSMATIKLTKKTN